MEKRSFFSRLTEGGKGAPLPASKKTIPAKTHHNEKRPIDTEQCPFDVYRTENELIIKALIAGVRSEDLEISLTNDTLTIRGVRTETDTMPPHDYYYRECYFGPFSRSMILPDNGHGDTIKATLKNGILTIRIPKEERGSITISEN